MGPIGSVVESLFQFAAKPLPGLGVVPVAAGTSGIQGRIGREKTAIAEWRRAPSRLEFRQRR